VSFPRSFILDRNPDPHGEALRLFLWLSIRENLRQNPLPFGRETACSILPPDSSWQSVRSLLTDMPFPERSPLGAIAAAHFRTN
jgi:hypothetical protein